MTNAQIAMENRVFLMEQGIIKPTDQKMIYTDDLGTREINVPEEVYTFDAWKKQGRIVLKGQHAIAKFKIWMPKRGRRVEEIAEDNNSDDNSDEAMQRRGFYKKLSFFFTIDQTKEIDA